MAELIGVRAMGAEVRKEWRSLPAWLRYGVVALLILGIFFRFYHLDRKVYWIDETNSSLRTLGYTRTEVLQEAFTGQVMSVEDYRQYQRLSPEKGWGDTMAALSGTAEHTPLYFLLARLWSGFVGHSVWTMRFLSAVFSVLAIPCLYWLCRQLFTNPAVAWTAIGLYAITPIHVLYAQEARPYSLLTVWVLLSSALLLRALDSGNDSGRWKNWLAYGVTIAAGFYTQLLFVFVLLAQVLYVLILEGIFKRRITRNLIVFGLTVSGASVSFIPWIVLLFVRRDRVSETTASLTGSQPLSAMIDRWFFHLNQAFFDRNLASANLLIVLLALFALYFLIRYTPPRTWLLLVLLVSVTFLCLAIPDVLNGGRRSLRIRYLFPFILGIQITFAFLFTTLAIERRGWQRRTGQLLFAGLVIGGLIACSISSQAVVWWNKSNPRSAYYPIVSQIINQQPNPLVISDGTISETLSFSAWLRPDVHLQLIEDFRNLKIAEGFSPVYLLNAEPENRRVLRSNYRLKLLYEDHTDPDQIQERLWTVERRRSN